MTMAHGGRDKHIISCIIRVVIRSYRDVSEDMLQNDQSSRDEKRFQLS